MGERIFRVSEYDFIGDVHGCADKLTGLLGKMGYVRRHRAYRQAGRTAVFVGDLIDRGPEQVEVLTIVRSMVDAGSALAVMGNHEFNAISYVTPDPRNIGDYMRTRRGPSGLKNQKQHAEFLQQVGEDSSKHFETIAWFKSLPLWLDLGAVRVVHACWHLDSMTALTDFELPTDLLPAEFFVNANTKGSDAYKAVEVLLKGPEVDLRPRGPYLDKERNPRFFARIRWWDPAAVTLRALAEIPSDAVGPDDLPFPLLPDEPSNAAEAYRYADDVPVFFGHYWFHGTPTLAGPHTACLDFSAVRDGPLVAYRWEGESILRNEHLVSFGDNTTDG
jgi:hypothetical protein